MKPKLPKLPLNGIDPWLTVADDANRAYAAYWGGQPLIDNYLQQHPRETDKDYEYRKKTTYGLGETARALNWLTRTIGNEHYAIERSFGPTYPDLEKLSTESAPSGNNWDKTLHEWVKDAYLGAVSYLFLDQTTAPALEDPLTEADKIKNGIEGIVIRSSQVWDIVLSSQGYVRQCSITTSDSEGQRLIQYFDLPPIDEKTQQLMAVEVPGFVVYSRKDDKHDWTLIDSGPNPIGLAPLVPLVTTGKLSEPQSIRSKVQVAARLDVDIMNQVSDARNAFGLFNYPMLAIPEADDYTSARTGLINQDKSGVHEVHVDGYGPIPFADPNKTNKNELVLSAAQAINYHKDKGLPFFVTQDHLYLDKTLELVNFLKTEINELIGMDVANSNPLASGIAKEFDFQDKNEVFRQLHAILQAAEYQAWYLQARMISTNRANDFQAFKQDVTIKHPVFFDPGGGELRGRLDAILKSPLYPELTPEVKQVIHQQYVRSNLKDIIPSDQLQPLIDKIPLPKPIVEEPIEPNGPPKTTNTR